MLHYIEGIFILVQTTIGVGIIGIPYTISLSGIPVGVAFLAYFLLITYYSIHLLIKLKTQTFLSSIPLIAYEVLGKSSFYAFTIMLAIAQLIIILSYLLSLTNFIDQKASAKNYHFPLYWKLILIGFFSLCNLAYSYSKKIDTYKFISYFYILLLIAFPVALAMQNVLPHQKKHNLRQLQSVPTSDKNYLGKEGSTWKQRFLEFDPHFILGIPRMMVAYTFQVLFFSVQNSLRPRNRTEYRGMCSAFITTMIVTIFYLLLTILLILKNFVMVDVQEKYEFNHLAKMEFSGYIAICIVLFHAPILYFNAKDTVLIIIGQSRIGASTKYLQSTGLSMRLRSEVKLDCSSGSTDVLFRNLTKESQMNENIRFEIPIKLQPDLETPSSQSQFASYLISPKNGSIQHLNQAMAAQSQVKEDIFLRQFSTQTEKCNQKPHLRGFSQMTIEQKKTMAANLDFYSTLLYDHKHYYRDLTILNVIVFIFTFAFFFLAQYVTFFLEFVEWFFSALPLSIVCYLFPSIAYLKRNGIKQRYALVLISMIVIVIMLVGCIPLLIFKQIDEYHHPKYALLSE